MSQNYYGLDLGTFDIKVYESRPNSIKKYKNAIALRKIQNKKQVIAEGDEAYEMYERCAPDIKIVYPMSGGVISDFDAMQYLLSDFVWGSKRSFWSSGYLLAAPADVTELEKKTFFDLIVHSDARTRNVRLVPKAVADAIGMELDVFSRNGIFTVNIGGATTEYAIIASGGLVIDKMEKYGGSEFNLNITNYIRKDYGFLIGVFAAEELKNSLGNAFAVEETVKLVPGRSLASGLPGEIQISAHEVYTAIRPCLEHIAANCRAVLDRIPPEMSNWIGRKGLYLTGGVARLKNIGRYLEKELGIPVHIAEAPDLTTIYGLKTILGSKEYEQLAYSMLDKNYRWMR